MKASITFILCAFFLISVPSVALATTGEGKDKEKDKTEKTDGTEKTDKDKEKKEVKQPKVTLADMTPESLQSKGLTRADSTEYSASNRFNLFFSFVYKYKYEEKGNLLKKLFGE